jgi:hypothetical protein
LTQYGKIVGMKRKEAVNVTTAKVPAAVYANGNGKNGNGAAAARVS